MVGYAFHYKKSKEEMKRMPPWVKLLLKSKFFGACEEHKDLRKSEENIYCIDCNHCMCPHCLVPHRHHQFLQIRRYVYQDVIRILDVQRLLDLSHVQPYIVNSAKVVLLNPRRQSKPSKSNPAGSLCKICHRTVAESSRYCSIACKVINYSPPIMGNLVISVFCIHSRSSQFLAWVQMSEEFDDSTVLSGSEDGCKQSEPFLENLTSDLENYAPKEMESSASSLSSLRPSDSSETDQGRSIPPPIRFRRQKGIPCRAPFF
ncbi:uncharacterized protein [Typha angustifolia]|uniref:uncharacterized protein isoform X1 n=1 Tax=Typha angustifolia TaxID=59011 RepID=UPI003C2AD2BB